MRLKKPLLLSYIVILFCGCGSQSGSDSPANAVKDFVLALKEQKPEKAWTYLSQNSKEMYENIAKNRNQSGKEYFENNVTELNSLGTIGMDFEVVEVKKEGDSASVLVKTFKNGVTAELFTINENGVWKLDYERSIEESIKSANQ
jgi:hypothetical protein